MASEQLATPAEHWRRLQRGKNRVYDVCEAPVELLADRKGFHHLNRDVVRDFLKLEARTENKPPSHD
jgi:hypothetical protein